MDLNNTSEQTNEARLEVIQELLDQAGSELDKVIISDNFKAPVTDIKVEWIDRRKFLVTWKCLVPGVELDIEYFAVGAEKEWQHSVAKYFNYHKDKVLSQAEQHPIGFPESEEPKNYDHNVRIGIINRAWKSPEILLKKDNGSKGTGGGTDTDVPGQPEDQKELIPLIDSEAAGGDQFPRFKGIIKVDDKLRVFFDRSTGGGTMVNYIDINPDFESWSKARDSKIRDLGMNLYQFQDKILGYKVDTGGLNIFYDLVNGEFINYAGIAYDWNFDGKISFHFSDSGHFRAFGRMRGMGNHNSGRWENIPPYPKQVHAWQRRGGSYHPSKIGSLEEFLENPEFREPGRVLVDPAEIFKTFMDGKYNGYYDKDNPYCPQFYEMNVMENGLAFPKIQWARKDREIDRGSDIEKDRRYRLTGPTYPIVARYDDSSFELLSDESVIPLHFHERAVDHPLDPKPGQKEVGQINIYPGVIQDSKGRMWVLYCYRDDVHYLGGWEGQKEGVYIYRLTDEFIRKFGVKPTIVL